MLERFEEFTHTISEISQYWNKIASEEMKCYDLKGAYAVYLIVLKRHPEGITSAQLCDYCAKDKAEISRAVSLMEKRGLATRETIGGNTYRALIRLTPDGAKAAGHISERAKLAVKEGGSNISVSDREVFYRTLKQIASNLKAISEKGLTQ